MTEEKKEALGALQKMVFNKQITETIRRAMRLRLEVILESEETNFRKWNDRIKDKLNPTRQKQVERTFNKNIQALKIVVNYLTPFHERVHDAPMFIVKKRK